MNYKRAGDELGEVCAIAKMRESKTNPGFLSKSPADSSDVCCLEDLKSSEPLLNITSAFETLRQLTLLVH